MSASSLFPYARFSSLLGVHSTLFLFTAFYLPQTAHSTLSSARLPPTPQLTLVWLCIGVGIVQASWASWLKYESESARLIIFGDDEAARMERTMKSGRDRLQTLKDAIVSTLASSFFIHVVLVLFGAPLVGHFSKTYLLALLLSLLVVYPNVYTLRPPSLKSDSKALIHRWTWLRLFAGLSVRSPYERLLVYPAVGTVLGAWLGAFPIALDWDRPWQAWPLLPAYGAIAGNMIGLWSSLAVNAVFFLAAEDRAVESEKSRVDTTPSTKKKAGGSR